MNLKKFSFLFWTTLCVGGAVMLLTGLSMQLFQQELTKFNGPMDILMNIFLFGIIGLLISVYAQMGFFAYLTLNYIALGFFKKSWPYIQIVITVFVILDLMFLRTLLGHDRDILADIMLGVALLVVAVVVTYFKAKATNSLAVIPTLFFMIAGTTVETLSALNVSHMATWFVFIPLVACNAYQILMLHRVLGDKKEETAESISAPVITAKS